MAAVGGRLTSYVSFHLEMYPWLGWRVGGRVDDDEDERNWRRPSSSSSSLPESAAECTASASIEAYPVMMNATSLVAAMPTFASVVDQLPTIAGMLRV